jgi:hypothetical protein
MAINFNLQSILPKKEIKHWFCTEAGMVTHKFGKGQNEWGDRDYQKLAKHWIQLVNLQVYQYITQPEQTLKLALQKFSTMAVLHAQSLNEQQLQSLIAAEMIDMVAVDDIPASLENLQKKIEQDQYRIKEKIVGLHTFNIRTKTPELSASTEVYTGEVSDANF